jgi:hypothetical protein
MLALDRETAIIAALFALIVSGVVVSFGAWVLLRRERRGLRSGPPVEAGLPPEPTADRSSKL